jgi:hypothetical protein
MTGLGSSTDAAVSTVAARGSSAIVRPNLRVYLPVVTHCGRPKACMRQRVTGGIAADYDIIVRNFRVC